MPPSVGIGLGPLSSWPGVSGETSRSMRSLDWQRERERYSESSSQGCYTVFHIRPTLLSDVSPCCASLSLFLSSAISCREDRTSISPLCPSHTHTHTHTHIHTHTPSPEVQQLSGATGYLLQPEQLTKHTSTDISYPPPSPPPPLSSFLFPSPLPSPLSPSPPPLLSSHLLHASFQ